MIKPDQYVGHKKGDFQYVTCDMVASAHDSDEYEKFKDWIDGQTVSIANDGISAAIYAWDYERWVGQGCQVEQGKDWD